MANINHCMNRFHLYSIEFLTAMEETFPDNKKLTLYNQNYQITMNADPNLAIVKFIENFSTFRSKVLKDDIEDIINYDVSQIRNSNLAEVLNLKHWWSQMPVDIQNENKTIICDYLKLLYKYSDEYVRIKNSIKNK